MPPPNLFRSYDFVKMLKGIAEKINFGILEKIAVIIAIVSGIIAIINPLLEGIKMVLPFLTKIESFWLLMAVWFFTLLLLWINRSNRKKKESKLEETTKQYDALVELTTLPPEDKIITIEPAAYLEVVKRGISDIPDLNFILNVHNHSYYFFTLKRVELKCYNSGKKVLEDVWDVEKDKEYISAKKHITVDGSLPKYQSKSIIFKVPIEKRYDDWYNWDLEGGVTYTNGEEERNVKIDTHHQMSDKNRLKLEKLLEDALGDEL
ncbi:MAG: hypothetical protein KAT65_22340 [Methanophagales archaeon]|nr:hypothetical protein [Methanophagales archaeon]